MLDAFAVEEGAVVEASLSCACGTAFPVIAGIPRILPDDAAATLPRRHPEFFRRHPELLAPRAEAPRRESLRTLLAFGDEWQRFPEIMEVHERIFRWYFEGPEALEWKGLRVLDAGCGMGRWLHFARRAGADIVGMDVSPAIDVVYRREDVDLVQADLRSPPFAEGEFDLVYSLGVLHHLEDPRAGVRALAPLVRRGGELRLYVYRTLGDEAIWKRALVALVSGLRRVTTRMPAWVLHGFCWFVAVLATVLFIVPRRLLRRLPLGDRLTRGLPLTQYTDVPFRMLVAEQFDRFTAPLEGRYRREQIEGWLSEVGLDVVTVLPDLGWRAIARRPA